jgi:serine/threonine-protein kinase
LNVTSTQRPRDDLAPGTLLHGTYEIVRRVGGGGMGEVYEARHRRLAGRYAVKVLRDRVSAGSPGFARFKREAEVASSLRHPNIVNVLDFNVLEDGTPYLAMELLEGNDLGSEIARLGRLPLERALVVLEQIVAALSAAHGRGIIHRDLKPSNVFLVPSSGRRPELVKLLDFGISKNLLGPELTGDAAVIGTPHYMSPEQAEGRSADLDARSDQFSLAVVLYEMLSGQRPFEGDSAPAILYAIVHRASLPLTPRLPEVPPAVDAVLARAMAKRKEDRFLSVIEFFDELAAAVIAPGPGLAAPAKPEDVSTLVPTSTDRSPSEGSRRGDARAGWRWRAWATVLAVAATGIAVAVSLGRRARVLTPTPREPNGGSARAAATITAPPHPAARGGPVGPAAAARGVGLPPSAVAPPAARPGRAPEADPGRARRASPRATAPASPPGTVMPARPPGAEPGSEPSRATPHPPEPAAAEPRPTRMRRGTFPTKL